MRSIDFGGLSFVFSGGLDSTTTLAIAKSAGYAIFAISFNYGQRHKVEIDKAKITVEDGCH